MDNGLNLRDAQAAQGLQQQNDRLQLLLKLTKSITANLELKDVLRAIAANVREVMRCDAANISLPGSEPGTFRVSALDFPGRKDSSRKNRSSRRPNTVRPKRAFDALKPVIVRPAEVPPKASVKKSLPLKA